MSLPWLWLYGPSGVGKSAIGYEVFSQLRDAGSRVGFVEIDQIGMCMPTPSEVRSAATADNLLAMLGNFSDAGAEGVVVSGDIAGAAMDDVLCRTSEPPVLCRLRADHDVVVERLTARGSPQYAAASRTYDEDHVVPPGDLCLTTHPRGVVELAGEIVEAVAPWPRRHRESRRDADVAPRGGAVLLVNGPRAVGKSTVAWQLFMRSVARGVRSGYLDLEQMGFLDPSSDALRLANVAACWDGFHRQGAQRLVLCGGADAAPPLDRYRRLFPSLRVVSLTAGYDTILERAAQRSRAKEIWLPGDDLFGLPAAALPAIAERSAAFAPQGADVVIATDELSADQVAAQVDVW